MNDDARELMLDLLYKKAASGLEGHEERQLAELQEQAGVDDESLSFELTAASIAMAGVDKIDEMPASLREKIAADAEKHFASPSTSRIALEEAPRPPIFAWLGWAFAAAACLVLAVNLYYTRPSDQIAQQQQQPPVETLTPSQMRERLIATAPDLARGVWGAGNMKQFVPAGDIVWSDTAQAGYMRLSGLPVNDPNKETYQLWIFDETQDPKTPIDGGTFDVNSSGEVIIPINAKLRPRNTSMYAITVEKPGGVVVSDRSKIIALAKRET